MSAKPPSWGDTGGRMRLRGRLIAALTLTVALSVLAAGFLTITAFERAIAPELANRTQLIGSVVRAEVQRALDLGVPLDSVAGLDDYLERTLTDFPEVERIAIGEADGDVVAEARRASGEEGALHEFAEAISVTEDNVSLTVLRGNRIAGEIDIEISPTFVQTRLRQVFLDLGVLALVAVLIAVELCLVVVVTTVGKPLERLHQLIEAQRAGDFSGMIRVAGLGGLRRVAERLNDHAADLAARARGLPADVVARAKIKVGAPNPLRLRLSDFNDIRLALFLFCFGTEVSAAFMPVFASEASRPSWLSADVAAAAPLVFYLAAIAAVSPFGSRLIGWFGPRRLFALSAPLAALTLAGLAVSQSVIAITVLHGLMAASYAAGTIAGQEYAIRASGGRDRARAVGAFVAVALGGVFAGTAFGGLAAGRFGFEAAFSFGAFLALISIPLGLYLMSGRAGDRPQRGPADPSQDAGRVRSGLSFRLVTLILCVSVPMNGTFVIITWYLVPLLLADIGNGPAEIARVLVLYNVAIFFGGPIVAQLADGAIGPRPLIVLGALVSGAAVLWLTFGEDFWAIAVTVLGVGIGQVLMQAPMFAQALRITGGPGPGIDAFRLMERLGAIAGLTACALLLEPIGVSMSLFLWGSIILGGVVFYALVEIWPRRQEAERATT